MNVIKRDGTVDQVRFEKIAKRVSRAAKDLKNVDTTYVAQQVIQGLYDGVSTRDLDKLAVETAYSLSVRHPDYDVLATRLAISSLHKDTPSTFSECINILNNSFDMVGNKKELISEEVFAFIKKHQKVIDTKIDYQRDYLFDYFGFKTLERAYLLKVFEKKDNKITQKIVERPQHLFMRVSCEIHRDDIDAALNTYEMLSTFQISHATPTLFNSALKKNNLSSCFLIKMKEDSVVGIYDTFKQLALISQSAGGIGLNLHEIRSKGSPIYGTNGVSNGLVPLLRVVNETARFIDQGGGKRKGSIAIYLEPWHSDIEDFLDLRKNNGKEELRARDLNLAIWTPDLFFKKVEADEDWYLMDPNISKGLADVYGEDFDKLYQKYIDEVKFVKKVKARDIWSKILDSQIETGQPYILAKDAANKKSNQKNIGTIFSSNLCCEIFEVSSSDEIACCNLASISLTSCVDIKKDKKVFNFDKLKYITKHLVDNLNKIIDIEYYPVEEARKSNFRHRPIAIGIQGLANVFALLRLPFDSEEARKLNKDIAEAMYFAALEQSNFLAEKYGTYETFFGSPISQGILQFDLWGIKPSESYDWNDLKEKIKKNGVRNSLLIARMPTASSSQILSNVECFEPITSNIYKRATLSGEFIQVNKYLVEDLLELDLWTDEMRQRIIINEGSIQNIKEIPDNIKSLYKTVWEISQKVLIDMSADRGAFTCQGESLNLYFKNANYAKLTSAYFYAWKKGLKTIVYYTRTQSALEAGKFSVDKELENKVKAENLATLIATKSEEENTADLVCSLDNPDACISCGS